MRLSTLCGLHRDTEQYDVTKYVLSWNMWRHNTCDVIKYEMETLHEVISNRYALFGCFMLYSISAQDN
jgi:hypothetical protein